MTLMPKPIKRASLADSARQRLCSLHHRSERTLQQWRVGLRQVDQQRIAHDTVGADADLEQRPDQVYRLTNRGMVPLDRLHEARTKSLRGAARRTDRHCPWLRGRPADKPQQACLAVELRS